MADDANRLRTEPAFYHTLFGNCTTRIVDHINEVTDTPVRQSRKIFLSGYSDAYAHELGLPDAEGTIAQVRERWYANERAREWRDSEEYALRIRGGVGGETSRPSPPGFRLHCEVCRSGVGLPLARSSRLSARGKVSLARGPWAAGGAAQLALGRNGHQPRTMLESKGGILVVIRIYSPPTTESRIKMQNSDDFVVIVPTQGEAFLAEPGDDLSLYVGQHFTHLNKAVALKDGRHLQGSVYRGRETSASDEVHILDLINQQFTNTAQN